MVKIGSLGAEAVSLELNWVIVHIQKAHNSQETSHELPSNSVNSHITQGGHMEPVLQDIGRILGLLKEGPLRIGKAISKVQAERLHVRTDEEPWSVSDILAHLRACSDVWGETIMTILTEDNPTQRYKSPRAFMKRPKYLDKEFAIALASYTQERQKLVKVLTNLDGVGWARPGTYTGTTPRHRNQTVWSLTNRIVGHEQPHLEQIESLLR